MILLSLHLIILLFNFGIVCVKLKKNFWDIFLKWKFKISFLSWDALFAETYKNAPTCTRPIQTLPQNRVSIVNLEMWFWCMRKNFFPKFYFKVKSKCRSNSSHTHPKNLLNYSDTLNIHINDCAIWFVDHILINAILVQFITKIQWKFVKIPQKLLQISENDIFFLSNCKYPKRWIRDIGCTCIDKNDAQLLLNQK